jgi:hypothetical protein
MLKADEPHTFEFDNFPAWNRHVQIQDRDAFGEMKPSNKQGPKLASRGKIPSIVTHLPTMHVLHVRIRPWDATDPFDATPWTHIASLAVIDNAINSLSDH